MLRVDAVESVAGVSERERASARARSASVVEEGADAVGAEAALGEEDLPSVA